VIDRLRRRAQLHAMLKALHLCDCAIFTVPMEKISWIKNQFGKSCFIPVGANLPTASEANSRKGISTGGKLSVAVFSITGGKSRRWEIDNIVEAVRFAASRVGNLRLVVLGRYAQEAESELKQRFLDSAVELHVMEFYREQRSCEVSLFRTSCSLCAGLSPRGEAARSQGLPAGCR